LQNYVEMSNVPAHITCGNRRAGALCEFILSEAKDKANIVRQGREIFSSEKILLTDSLPNILLMVPVPIFILDTYLDLSKQKSCDRYPSPQIKITAQQGCYFLYTLWELEPLLTLHFLNCIIVLDSPHIQNPYGVTLCQL